MLNGVSQRVMKTEEGEAADLAEDGRQRVSLLFHHCRHRVRRLQRLLLLPRPLPLRRRPHPHDSLLQLYKVPEEAVGYNAGGED